MASCPAYNAYANDVLMPAMDQTALAEIKGYEAAGDFENPRCLQAIESIAKACASAKKPWGVFSRGPDYAAKMRSWGCQLFVLAADIHAVHAGIRDVKNRYSSFFTRR